MRCREATFCLLRGQFFPEDWPLNRRIMASRQNGGMRVERGVSAGHEVLVEVVRSGFVEGSHHGTVVATDANGGLDWAVGDAEAVFLPRSCNKPLQAVAMVRAGLDLPPHLLAMACASHSGESFHVEAVREILAAVGLDETALQNPIDWPLDREEERALARAGGEPTRLHMNCSGKHAAMLATCVVNGWSIDDYLAPTHPLQMLIREVFAELVGDAVGHDAVDGCGAPLLGTSPLGLARAFRALVVSDPASAEGRVATAIREHPTYISGTRRDEVRFLEAVPASIGKFGAEACHVMALADGRAFVVKIADGGDRARPLALAAALERSGVVGEPSVDAEAIRALGRHHLSGGNQVVGELRVTTLLRG